MREPPLTQSGGLLHFTNGTLAYAGQHFHERRHRSHTHSFVEIAVVIGGRGVHRSVAGARRLRVGDVVVLRPGVWHSYEDCFHLHVYNCCISTDLLLRELAWTREDPLLGHLLWTGPQAPDRRGVLVGHLGGALRAEALQHLDVLAELRSKPPGRHRGDVIGRLTLFLSCVARAVSPYGRDAGPRHPAVAHAMRLMEAEPAYRWTLTELADRLHLAPRYLVRLFKSATGLPPMAYLSRFRAETAAGLLLHTDEPVKLIGQRVGWPDQNYFARRFKAHYGLSASTYRRRFSQATVHLPDGLPVRPAGPDP
jgi:AraC-like DNA-binding protein